MGFTFQRAHSLPISLIVCFHLTPKQQLFEPNSNCPFLHTPYLCNVEINHQIKDNRMRKNRVFTFFLLALVAFTSCKEEQKQTPSSYCH